jgi:hypothetical protein
MVNELELSFKKLFLISLLTVLLCVAMIYALGHLFGSETSTGPHTSTLPILVTGHLLVFAYSDSGFVEASVELTGPQLSNPTSNEDISMNVTTLNGTTSTDLQNPLEFLVQLGTYSVSSTYGSAPTQNTTLNVTSRDQYSEVVFNFSSSPLPRLGHIIVYAWYWSANVGRFVQASLVITGPESLRTTSGNYPDPSVFTVEPGVYSISGTYGSAPAQSATVDVKSGEFSRVFLNFQ